jgi:phage recombination protein Bet
MTKDVAKNTAVAPIKSNIPSLEMDEAELVRVLESSLYPGAKLESIKLVIGYCKAQQLDPLQKPIHIVPISVKVPGTDRYELRDVIMPGVGLYRTQAARTGLYAGKTEPEFGDVRGLKYGDQELQYPDWCRVTVKRVVNGVVCEFTAMEFWMENYATAGNSTAAPNKMWKKRAFGQLAKCAEAQALRMAFPEAVGAAPTAEEMEGKALNDDYVEPARQIAEPQRADPATNAAAPKGDQPAPSAETVAAGEGSAGKAAAPAPAPSTAAASDKAARTAAPAESGPDSLNDGQIKVLRARMIASGVPEGKVDAVFLWQFKVALAAGAKVSINPCLTWARELSKDGALKAALEGTDDAAA